MAEATRFNHDYIGHILSEGLLEVPEFQRRYSWEAQHVKEYLDDLSNARKSDQHYFVGTLVFVDSKDTHGRVQIVDGQQRLATTSILIIAIRDRLRELGKDELASRLQQQFLKGYVLAQEEEVVGLQLSPRDQDSYDSLIEGDVSRVAPEDPLLKAYQECKGHLEKLAPTPSSYKNLIMLSEQLERRVQVLTAVASSLGEAYVIFETLNDRGADLTTADLLKNFLFSSAGSHIKYVQQAWIELETHFQSKPEDLVKFIRHYHISRNGPTQARALYRAIQKSVGEKPADIKKFAKSLKDAAKVYMAIKDPDNPFWLNNAVDTQDALLAYRRFGFESSMPLLLAIFSKMTKTNANKTLIKITAWSVRAQFTGRLGAQQSEKAFGNAAKAVSDAAAKTQGDICKLLADIIPGDSEFERAFAEYGAVPSPRAKYLLAMLEAAYVSQVGGAKTAHNWSARSVTIEHVMAKSTSGADPSTINSLGNLALLQRKQNKDLDDKPFNEKREVYRTSEFRLTSSLADEASWGAAEINARAVVLAQLACLAWPAN